MEGSETPAGTLLDCRREAGDPKARHPTFHLRHEEMRRICTRLRENASSTRDAHYGRTLIINSPNSAVRTHPVPRDGAAGSLALRHQ